MAIELFKIGKEIGKPPTTILHEISLSIVDGEFTAITGRSGSGKSTLLYVMSGLDQATSGKIEIANQDLSRLTPRELNRFRNEKMGFVFQFHYLLAELSALDNVLMPAVKAGLKQAYVPYGHLLLKQFGLADKLHRLPRQLSGGEQQRVAIARALIMKPKYLFVDEPTGSLDSVNGEMVMEILKTVNQKMETTIVMVTHEPTFAAYANQKICLVDGRTV